MNQIEIDNMVSFLFVQYGTGDKDVDLVIVALLNDLKRQLEGMKDD